MDEGSRTGTPKSSSGNKNGDTEVSPFLTMRFNWNYPARFVTGKSTEYLFCGKPLRLMGRTIDLKPRHLEPQLGAGGHRQI
jgi:hypothetical protein